MDRQRIQDLQDLLDDLYRRYNRPELIAPDPLQFPHRYRNRLDQEAAGLIAALLAYGRVAQIAKAIEQVLQALGPRPHMALVRFRRQGWGLLGRFRYRFTTASDLLDLFEVVGWALGQAGSLEALFMAGHEHADGNVLPALDRFCQVLLDRSCQVHDGGPRPGLRFLLARPSSGSGCKRLNMFLRWMVRQDRVDLGLWRGVDPADLVFPVDTHINRICRLLGLHDGGSVTLASAVRLTRSFAQICPQDPVRYDFALSRVGIVEGCTGVRTGRCSLCRLRGYCVGLGPR